MKVFAILAIVLFSFFAVALGQTAKTASSSDLQVTTNPGAGTIQFTTLANDRTFSLGFNQIQEVSVSDDGVPNAINSFSNANFQVSEPNFQMTGSLNYTSFDMSAGSILIATPTNVTNFASIGVQIWLMQSEGTVTINGEDFDVTPSQAVVKFTLNNWPAVDSDNHLNIRMSVTTPGSGASMSDNSLNFDDGSSIFFPEKASLNGRQGNVALSSASSDNVVTFTMRTNATSSTDYAFVYSAEGKGSSAATLSSFLSFLF